MWKVLVHDIIVTQLQRHSNATDCSFVLNPSQSNRKRELFFISHIVFIFLDKIYRFKFFITFLERNFSYFYSNVKLLRNASEFNSRLVHNIQQLTSVVRGIRNYCVVFLFSFYFNNQSSEQKHNKMNLLTFSNVQFCLSSSFALNFLLPWSSSIWYIFTPSRQNSILRRSQISIVILLISYKICTKFQQKAKSDFFYLWILFYES